MLESIEMFQNSKLNAGFTNTSKINSLHKQKCNYKAIMCIFKMKTAFKLYLWLYLSYVLHSL